MNAIDKEKLKALMKKYENVCDIQTHIDKDTNLAKALIIAVVLSSLLICMLMCTYDSKMTSYLGLGHKRSNGK